MRITRAAVLVVVAACGGGGSQTKETVEQPVVQEPPPKKEPPPPPKPLTLEEKVAFHDGCFADFVAEAPDFFERCYTESSSDELVDTGDPPAVGIEAIKAASKPFWDGFALEGQILLNVASENSLFTVAILRGTNDADFMGMPASNKTFGQLVAEVQSLDDKGRHGAVRTYVDMATFMAHLGGAKKGTKFRPVAELGGEPMTVIAEGSEAETANLAFVRSGFELFAKHDAKAMTALYAPDAVISQQMAPADVKGAKAITKMFKEFYKAFPDAELEVTSSWAAGEFVVAEATLTGTNKAAAKGMGIKKATKKPVTLHTAHVFRIVDGKVAQHWEFANGLAMAIQLGLVKPPPKPEPKEPAEEPADAME
jgi:steroid delta-isomerase-like uncharacterized protein